MLKGYIFDAWSERGPILILTDSLKKANEGIIEIIDIPGVVNY